MKKYPKLKKKCHTLTPLHQTKTTEWRARKGGRKGRQYLKLHHFFDPLQELGIDSLWDFVVRAVAGIQAYALGGGVEIAHALGHTRTVICE